MRYYKRSETVAERASLTLWHERAWQGMEDSAGEFEALVVNYEKRIYNLLLRMVNDPEEAADLTQDTFVRAYRAFGRFRGDSQPYTWLYRIAVNIGRDHLAKRGRIRKHEIEISAMEGEAEDPTHWEPVDTSASPEDQLIQQEMKQQIAQAIEQMPSDYREIILLREYEELSYEQIAQTLGISLEAVRSRLARARAWLRQRLAHYFLED